MLRVHSFLYAFVLLLILTLMFPGAGDAQLWSGTIASSRAVDWSGAGAGAIPPRTTNCATLGAAGHASSFVQSVTAAQIVSAISSCAAGQTVFLNAGIYTLNNGIDFGSKNNVTLRGAGADQTLLVFTNSTNCRGFGSAICMGNSQNPQMPSPNNTATWTAGYAKGTTVITVGSSSGMSVGDTLILDQLDDASDGYPTAGDIFVCATSSCTGQGGDAFGRAGRSQQQLVTITNIAGNQVTISPGLYMQNWRSSQSPGVSWADSTLTGDGVENLSLDFTNSGCGSFCGVTVMLYTSNCWVKGIRSITAFRNHVWLYQTTKATVRDSYFWGTLNAQSQSYGVEMFSTSNVLVENNIFQRVVGSTTINGSDSGSVYAYNISSDDKYDVSLNWMIPSYIMHESGIAMDLFEGNDGLSIEGDNIHGTHQFMTSFRNYLYGDAWNLPPKSNNTDIFHLWRFNRFFNVVGNVLGRTGYYNNYAAGNATSIFSINGDADGSSPAGTPSDPRTAATLLRWGNWDTVTNATRWCGNSSDTGWSTTCASTTEVPSTLTNFANPVPSTETLPPSFYLTSKPSWWTSGVPWPAIGPDVTGGSVSGVGGHAYPIPARSCFLSIGGTIVAGIDSIPLTFNAKNCYGAGALPAPPTGFQVVVH